LVRENLKTDLVFGRIELFFIPLVAELPTALYLMVIKDGHEQSIFQLIKFYISQFVIR